MTDSQTQKMAFAKLFPLFTFQPRGLKKKIGTPSKLFFCVRILGIFFHNFLGYFPLITKQVALLTLTFNLKVKFGFSFKVKFKISERTHGTIAVPCDASSLVESKLTIAVKLQVAKAKLNIELTLNSQTYHLSCAQTYDYQLPL